MYGEVRPEPVIPRNSVKVLIAATVAVHVQQYELTLSLSVRIVVAWIYLITQRVWR